MRSRILPKTILGKWSVTLAFISIILTFLSLVLVSMGNHLDTDAPWIGALTGILALAAFVTGIIAFILSKERAILVYLGLVLLVLIFVLGEFLFPH
jgi:hypothetical protein